MFQRGELLIPQTEHTLFAATLAKHWGNNNIPKPPVDHNQFIRAVQTHDRGYPQFDRLPINGLPEEDWLDVQRQGFEHPEGDATVDILVKMHLHRIVLYNRTPSRLAYAEEMQSSIDELRKKVPYSEADLENADQIMCFCDSLSYDFCLNNYVERSFEVPSTRLTYKTDDILIQITPWPFDLEVLQGSIKGYQDYREESVEVPFRIEQKYSQDNQ